jgi:hypothetical protein
VSEYDPTGASQHASGAKLDGGKIRVALVLKAFSRALYAVCGVGTFGAVKYTDDGWLDVADAVKRYDDAKCRHQLKDWIGEEEDKDSSLWHLMHEAWGALAKLEKVLRERFESPEAFIDFMENKTKQSLANLNKE